MLPFWLRQCAFIKLTEKEGRLKKLGWFNKRSTHFTPPKNGAEDSTWYRFLVSHRFRNAFVGVKNNGQTY